MHLGILLDSATTCHMFSNYNLFSYEKIHDNPDLDNDHVFTRGHNKVPAVSHSTVCIYTHIGPNALCNITLDNILHIPKMGTNLVSMGTL